MTANTQVEVTPPADGFWHEVHGYFTVEGADDVQMEHTVHPKFFCPSRIEIEWTYESLSSEWELRRVSVSGRERKKDGTLGKNTYSREYRGLYHSVLVPDAPLWVRDTIEEHTPK